MGLIRTANEITGTQRMKPLFADVGSNLLRSTDACLGQSIRRA
jgi:hypothetical protein